MPSDPDDFTTYAGRLTATLDIAGEPSTLCDHTRPDEGMEGRYARQKPQYSSPHIPRIKTGPWASADPSGLEPPLGYRVDDVPDLGVGTRSGAAPAKSPAVETTDKGRGVPSPPRRLSRPSF